MKHWNEYSRDERIALIRQVWKSGMSAGRIADAITLIIGANVTRNSVIGFYTRHRNDLLADFPLGGSREVGAIVRARKAAKVDRPKKTEKLILRPPPPQLWMRPKRNKKHEPLPEDQFVPREKPDDARFLPTAKPLIDLGTFECHYVVSNEPFLYCGTECGDRTYCEYHHAIVYTPRQPLTKG